MVFGEIVGLVGRSRFPEDMELLLADTIFQPIESHVDCLRVFHLDGVIGNSGGGAIVGLDGSCWLRMSHLSKGVANGASLFGVEEQGTEFGLSGTGHDCTDDVTEDVHCPIVSWGRVTVRRRRGRIGAEEQVSPSSRSGFGDTEVGCITVDPQDHVAGVVLDCGGWVGGTVIEEMVEGHHGSTGALGLLSGECAQGNKESAVNGSRVVEEHTDDFLDPFLAGRIKSRRRVNGGGILNFGTVHWLLPGGGGTHRMLGDWVFESEESTIDVARHG